MGHPCETKTNWSQKQALDKSSEQTTDKSTANQILRVKDTVSGVKRAKTQPLRISKSDREAKRVAKSGIEIGDTSSG